MRELGADEDVGQELHGVGTEAGDVLVGAGLWRRRGRRRRRRWMRRRVLGAEGGDAILDVLGHLGADFEAQDQFVGEEGGEGDEEAAEAAAYVCDRDGFRQWLDGDRLVSFFSGDGGAGG